MTALPTYSHQAVVLNTRLWKRLFSKVPDIPDMVCLEQEKIVSKLLERDLSSPKSLAWCIMFDPGLRQQILTELDGIQGCWDRKTLRQRLQKNSPNVLEGGGTMFFWGVNPLKGRRIPLYLKTGTNHDILCGVDDWGEVWEYPFTPQGIIEGLSKNLLLPSLFTCFLVFTFARSVAVLGAYIQGDYLPMMQQGIVRALQSITGYHDAAALVAQAPTNCYLSGMLAIMSMIEKNYLVPAGPLEIIVGGGITDSDIEKMLVLTVREAHLAALFETIPDAISPKLLPSDWKKHLAADCLHLLEGKVVIK
jgi:hypothetical protein